MIIKRKLFANLSKVAELAEESEKKAIRRLSKKIFNGTTKALHKKGDTTNR